MVAPAEGAPLALLQATVARHVDPAARIAGVRALPIETGASGAPVRRYELTLTGGPPAASNAAPATVRLVTKEAGPVERRALAHLHARGLPGVPFSHTLAPDTGAPALVAMQDVGDTHRPNSRSPIPAVMVQREAAVLAAIHAAHWGRGADLPWLPRADRAYFARMIEQVAWRPAWERAVADPAFRAAFAADLPRVEAAAAGIVDEMAALAAAGDALTLVHTDLNPSNVLWHAGGVYLVDWQAAHYGPAYLDVPHHFHTPALAEHYRAALAAHGIVIPPATFAACRRVAARYTALRYMWWTLAAWQEDPAAAVWVRHYFAMLDEA
jgi:phosphotransferase family enzyme